MCGQRIKTQSAITKTLNDEVFSTIVYNSRDAKIY